MKLSVLGTVFIGSFSFLILNKRTIPRSRIVIWDPLVWRTKISCVFCVYDNLKLCYGLVIVFVEFMNAKYV